VDGRWRGIDEERKRSVQFTIKVIHTLAEREGGRGKRKRIL
jgi:hypothetical protein